MNGIFANAYFSPMMRYLSILLALLTIFQVSGQSLVENQEKYWNYRQSLIKDYMVIGNGAGKSIPATGKDDEANYIYWGDATIRLGWYMTVLATEYHLLRERAVVRTEANNTIAKEQTAQELYYAIMALERLDARAEPFYDKSAPEAMNGFFIRDDVDQDFLDEFEDKKHLVSDYTSKKPTDNEMSQDQVHHLLMGLMAIYRYVPEVTEYKGVRIADRAKENALRIIDWLQTHKWDVVNPVRLNKRGKPERVARGADAYIFSQGTAKTMQEFLRGDEPKRKKVNVFNGLFWSTLRMGVNPTYIKDDNAHMAMTVTATSNGFRRVTYRKLLKRSFANDWYVYPLYNLAIYPNNRRSRKDMRIIEASRKLLDSAPKGGIVSPAPGTNETGWSSYNRFMRKRHDAIDPPDYEQGSEYPGLDYMLLHNLYLIHHKDKMLEHWEKK